MRLHGLGAKTIGLCGVAVVLAVACGGSSSGQQQVTITYASYGGALQKAEELAFIAPYMKLHPNIKIVYDATMDYSKLIAQVTTGNVSWDIADVGNDFGLTGDEKYLEKIDCTVVPCTALQPDKYPTTGYRAAWSVSGVALGYNTTKMPAGQTPQGWADYFDLKKFPGKRIAMSGVTSGWTLELALVADGVDQNSLYPLDIQRALRKWDTIKSQVTFTSDFQQCAESVATGDAALGACWSGRFYDVHKNGAPVAVQWNGTTLNGGYLSVPKGSKHVKEAMDFIAYMCSPKPEAIMANAIPYGGPNAPFIDGVNADIKPWLGTTYADHAIFVDDRWWDKNRDATAKIWQAWLTA
jgi:putative spermidine/putrescine transport system substrate-binding protein